MVEGTQVSNSTTQNTVNYDGLKPSTKYELQLYAQTNYGYNSEQELWTHFKTKTKCNMVFYCYKYGYSLQYYKLVLLQFPFPQSYEHTTGCTIYTYYT